MFNFSRRNPIIANTALYSSHNFGLNVWYFCSKNRGTRKTWHHFSMFHVELDDSNTFRLQLLYRNIVYSHAATPVEHLALYKMKSFPIRVEINVQLGALIFGAPLLARWPVDASPSEDVCLGIYLLGTGKPNF